MHDRNIVLVHDNFFRRGLIANHAYTKSVFSGTHVAELELAALVAHRTFTCLNDEYCRKGDIIFRAVLNHMARNHVSLLNGWDILCLQNQAEQQKHKNK